MLRPAIYIGSLLTEDGPLFLASEEPFNYADSVLSAETPVDVHLSASLFSVSASVAATSGGPLSKGDTRIFAAAAGTSLELVLLPKDGIGLPELTVPLIIQVSGSASCQGFSSSTVRLRLNGELFSSACPDAFSDSKKSLLRPNIPAGVQFGATSALSIDEDPSVVTRSEALAALNVAFFVDPAYSDRYDLFIGSEPMPPQITIPEPDSYYPVAIVCFLLWAWTFWLGPDTRL